MLVLVQAAILLRLLTVLRSCAHTAAAPLPPCRQGPAAGPHQRGCAAGLRGPQVPQGEGPAEGGAALPDGPAAAGRTQVPPAPVGGGHGWVAALGLLALESRMAAPGASIPWRCTWPLTDSSCPGRCCHHPPEYLCDLPAVHSMPSNAVTRAAPQLASKPHAHYMST